MKQLNPDTIFEMARSGEPNRIRELFDTFDDGNFSSNEDDSLEYGLIAGAPKTIDPLIGRLREAPTKKSGLRSAYYLGEIAYQQKYEQDPRILPELVAAFHRLKKVLPDELDVILAALSECGRFRAIPEAQAVAEEWLQMIKEQPSLSDTGLRYALAIYLVNNGWTKTIAFGKKLGQRSEDAQTLEDVEYFLERHRPKGWEPVLA